MPPADTSMLERDLHPDLLNLTFSSGVDYAPGFMRAAAMRVAG